MHNYTDSIHIKHAKVLICLKNKLHLQVSAVVVVPHHSVVISKIY